MSTDLTPLRPQIVARQTELDRLKPIQRRALDAILESPTIRAAAEAVGRDERTLYRWLNEPAFRRCLQDACASRELSLDIQAQHAASEAFSVLRRFAIHSQEYTRERIQAARCVLEYADRRSARRNERLAGG